MTRCASERDLPGGSNWQAPSPADIRIVTSRLVVRPFEFADAECLQRAISESRHRLAPWVAWGATDHQTVDRTIQFIADHRVALQRPHQLTGLALGVFLGETGELVGGTGVHGIFRSTAVGEVGYWTHAKHQAKGYCTEATRHLLSVLLKPQSMGGWGLARVNIFVSGDNGASRRIPEKLGLRLEVHQRRDLYVEGLGATDRLGWGVLAEEWDCERHEMSA